MRRYTNLIIFIEPSIKKIQARRHMRRGESDRGEQRASWEGRKGRKTEIEGDRDSKQSWTTPV